MVDHDDEDDIDNNDDNSDDDHDDDDNNEEDDDEDDDDDDDVDNGMPVEQIGLLSICRRGRALSQNRLCQAGSVVDLWTGPFILLCHNMET